MTRETEPARLGDIAASLPKKLVSGQITKPSPVSCDPVAFAKAMLTLTALKRTANLTEPQLRAWHAVLGTFKASTINRAVLLVVADQQRFPEVSDLWQQCRRIEKRQQPYNPHGGDVTRSLTEPEIAEIAARIGLEV